METKKFKIDAKKILVGTAKLLVQGVVTVGAGYIIGRYGKAVILPSDGKIKKLAMVVGASTLASLVGDAAGNYAGKQIDALVDAGSTIVSRFTGNEVEEEVDENVGCELTNDN